MSFSEEEKQLLLSVKGVGPIVIGRLEQMGFSSLQQLSDASYEEILISGAALTGSSCWKNSLKRKRQLKARLPQQKAPYFRMTLLLFLFLFHFPFFTAQNIEHLH
ncbi:Uncharacterised protein [Providencia rustigianii]|nr:Uncharacterised protein [Providencia rustigianii]